MESRLQPVPMIGCWPLVGGASVLASRRLITLIAPLTSASLEKALMLTVPTLPAVFA